MPSNTPPPYLVDRPFATLRRPARVASRKGGVRRYMHPLLSCFFIHLPPQPPSPILLRPPRHENCRPSCMSETSGAPTSPWFAKAMQICAIKSCQKISTPQVRPTSGAHESFAPTPHQNLQVEEPRTRSFLEYMSKRGLAAWGFYAFACRNRLCRHWLKSVKDKPKTWSMSTPVRRAIHDRHDTLELKVEMRKDPSLQNINRLAVSLRIKPGEHGR